MQMTWTVTEEDGYVGAVCYADSKSDANNDEKSLLQPTFQIAFGTWQNG